MLERRLLACNRTYRKPSDFAITPREIADISYLIGLRNSLKEYRHLTGQYDSPILLFHRRISTTYYSTYRRFISPIRAIRLIAFTAFCECLQQNQPARTFDK